jgi:hypothetical protein
MDQVFGLPVAYEEPISAVTATNSVDLGSRRIHKGESYVYCYNASDTQISPTYGVKLVTGASGYSVAVTSLTDTAHPCVGVVKNVTLTTNTYGWVMTKGFNQLENDADSTITGDYVAIALSKDGTFHRANPLTDAVHIGTFAVVGFALNADTASGGSFYGFVNTGF